MENIYIASAVILNNENELLLVRKKNSSFFQLVGGKIQEDETELQTLVREIREETGLVIPQDAFFFLGRHTTKAVNEEDTLVHGRIYTARLKHNTHPVAASEIEEFVWINKENYKKYNWARLAEEFVLPWWLGFKT